MHEYTAAIFDQTQSCVCVCERAWASVWSSSVVCARDLRLSSNAVSSSESIIPAWVVDVMLGRTLFERRTSGSHSRLTHGAVLEHVCICARVCGCVGGGASLAGRCSKEEQVAQENPCLDPGAWRRASIPFRRTLHLLVPHAHVMLPKYPCTGQTIYPSWYQTIHLPYQTTHVPAKITCLCPMRMLSYQTTQLRPKSPTGVVILLTCGFRMRSD